MKLLPARSLRLGIALACSFPVFATAQDFYFQDFETDLGGWLIDFTAGVGDPTSATVALSGGRLLTSATTAEGTYVFGPRRYGASVAPGASSANLLFSFDFSTNPSLIAADSIIRVSLTGAAGEINRDFTILNNGSNTTYSALLTSFAGGAAWTSGLQDWMHIYYEVGNRFGTLNWPSIPDGTAVAFELDNIRLSAAPIPEPASFAILLGGLAAASVILRRRGPARVSTAPADPC